MAGDGQVLGRLVNLIQRPGQDGQSRTDDQNRDDLGHRPANQPRPIMVNGWVNDRLVIHDG